MERGGVRGQCETASSISVLRRLQKQEQAMQQQRFIAESKLRHATHIEGRARRALLLTTDGY